MPDTLLAAPCRWVFCTCLCLLSWQPAPVAFADDQDKQQQWEAAFERDVLPIVQAKCIECHRGEDPDGGFDISPFNSGKAVSEKMDVWDEVGKRVRLREMPPEGSPQLNDHQKSLFHRWLDSRPPRDDCSSLATDETQAWYRGYVMSRRLTRTEYLNAIRDLVGIAVDADTIQIPSDGAGGEGFDTAGDALFTSPIHVERYLAAASGVLDTALPEALPSGASAAALKARERLLVVTPDDQHSESDAATEIIRNFARRAWRRPVSDSEVARLLELYDAARSHGASFVAAVHQPLKAILVSPNFLFVVESESAEGGVQKLTQHQLATRLALFLWSSVPDERLLKRADDGLLQTDEQVLAETRRMLADPKARALGENFGMQWLGMTHFLSSTRPDREVFPEFAEPLAEDLYEEAIRTVAGVFREDRSIMELMDADYVYVNGRLAAHYGFDLPADAPWQRLTTDDRRRGGVITLGAVLMNTSYPRRTSPVLRGRWILEEVLGGKVPPPPPGVPALEAAEASEAATLRERLEIHRQNPSCASCHNRMDPLGFGLENFDALGRWRTEDQGHAIDAAGKLPSGEVFHGPAELKQTLQKRAGEFKKHVSKKMLGFALGRGLNQFDRCVIDDCLEALDSQDQRAAAIIETIVISYPFQHRYFKAAK
ncbi:DUF1592 domain-containing protein [Roseimaritima ulvae]|uniref:Planctomycete cytochrome C n=1 Tax=Roseimaritima ulvae TaxID=980254 RepID=A0A5B9QKY8_9BACT|nr:DUF1592 domain-containing protein [Roseimaritima ulvae]QEG39574.1 hypothetical protein UC8_15700 [Roseimaritima ulvae]